MKEIGLFTSTLHDGVIKTPPLNADVAEEIKALLEAHGARMEEVEEIQTVWKKNGTVQQINRYCILHLPDGTTKEELWPITQQLRYQVTFPDGFQFNEYEAITGDLNLIRIPLSYFSPETQHKYRQ